MKVFISHKKIQTVGVKPLMFDEEQDFYIKLQLQSIQRQYKVREHIKELCDCMAQGM